MDEAHLCPSCGYVYNLNTCFPRILPCLHTACTPCLESMARSDGRKRGRDSRHEPVDFVVCFDCGKKHRLGSSGVKGFQANQYIIGFLQKSPVEMRVNEKCFLHNQPFVLYCTQCKQLLCTTCLVRQHNGHIVKELNEELKRKQEAITAERKLQISHIATGLNRLRDARKKIVATASKTRSKLVAGHAALRADVDAAFQAQLAELNSRAEQDEVTLQSHIHSLEKTSADLKRQINTSSFRNLMQGAKERRVVVPDVVQVSYALHSFSPPPQGGTTAASLLGCAESRKYQSTIPITGSAESRTDLLMKVRFYNRERPHDAGFSLDFSQGASYDEVVREVAEQLGVQPKFLLFFRPHSDGRGPGNAIRYTFEGSVEDLVSPAQPNVLYYLQLRFPNHDMINKKLVKVVWADPARPRTAPLELMLYPDKTGSVVDLFKQAKHFEEPEKVRLLEVKEGCIVHVVPDVTPVSALAWLPGHYYLLDRVADEDVTLNEDTEALVPCAHAQGEVAPFLLKLRDNQSFSHVKRNIKKRLKYSDADMKKLTFSICDGDRVTPIDVDYVMKLSVFVPDSDAPLQSRPWLRLDPKGAAPAPLIE